MSWVKTDYDFGYPFKVFTVGSRHVAQACQIRDFLHGFAQDPARIEAALLTMVQFYRPELAGCAIVSIDFRGAEMQFRIGVTHASFPRMAFAEGPQEEPLIGSEERTGHMHVVDVAQMAGTGVR